VTPVAATMRFLRVEPGTTARSGRVETNLRRERQMEGIAKAKAKGVYKGRKPSIDVDEVRRLREEEGLGATEIARHLGIVRSSVYRVLAQRPPSRA